jgi:hypothetical protein
VKTLHRGAVGAVALLFIAVPAGGLAQPAPSDVAADSAADAKEAAEKAALVFVSRVEDGDLGDVYDEELSPTFKALTSRAIFIQQSGFLRVQSGGRAAARELVGSQPFTTTPTGQTGTYYYVRFRTRFPNALVFQDIYLELIDGVWKISGAWNSPAPQQ